jgi:hypothetical protein
MGEMTDNERYGDSFPRGIDFEAVRPTAIQPDTYPFIHSDSFLDHLAFFKCHFS